MARILELSSMRMVLILIVSILLLLLDLYFSGRIVIGQPDPVHLIVRKLDAMSWGGWLGYWIDRGAYPYARPDIFLYGGRDTVFAAAQMRRAIIMAACIIGMAIMIG